MASASVGALVVAPVDASGEWRIVAEVPVSIAGASSSAAATATPVMTAAIVAKEIKTGMWANLQTYDV